MTLRTAVIRLALPLVWRLSRRRAVDALQEFAATEADSGWQALRAIPSVPDPALRARLLEHAMEEFSHAERFGRAAEALADSMPAVPAAERTALFRPEAGESALAEFFARLALGEREVSAEFEAYLAAAPFPEAREVFRSVLADERGHAEYTERALEQLAGPEAARGALRRARLAAWKESWLRFSRAAGELPLAILLSAVYWACGPLVRGACRAQLERRAPAAPAPAPARAEAAT